MSHQTFHVTALTEATRAMEFTAALETPEQVIQRAKAYLDFLTGDEQQQPSPSAESRKTINETRRLAYNQAIADVLSLREKFELHNLEVVIPATLRQVIAEVQMLRKN